MWSHIALQLFTIALEEFFCCCAMNTDKKNASKILVTSYQAPRSLPPKTVVIENLKSRRINANEAAVILNVDAKQGKLYFLTGI